jgi:hypothetical protein
MLLAKQATGVWLLHISMPQPFSMIKDACSRIFSNSQEPSKKASPGISCRDKSGKDSAPAAPVKVLIKVVLQSNLHQDQLQQTKAVAVP